MFRVGVIGFIYVMLLLTYMFRVGVIGFIYVMLLLTYMFRVGVIGFIYVMLLLTIFQLHCDHQFYLCRKANYTGNCTLCE
jgi:hypothetical protein